MIDSSIAASWAIPDEDSEVSRRSLDIVLSQGMLVPTIFWYEFRNVLIVNERRNRLSLRETQAALKNIADLLPETDAEMAGEGLMLIARQHKLTVYDAAYVELAKRNGARLATLDKKLASAASDEGVSVIA